MTIEVIKKKLMDNPIVQFVDEDLGKDGRLFLLGMIEHFEWEYMKVLDELLDGIKEVEVEDEGKYYYYLDIDPQGVGGVSASFNKDWLIQRLIADYFISYVT